jgi:hypothetical protein
MKKRYSVKEVMDRLVKPNKKSKLGIEKILRNPDSWVFEVRK